MAAPKPSAPTVDALAAIEAHRQADGKFGTQPHAAADPGALAALAGQGASPAQPPVIPSRMFAAAAQCEWRYAQDRAQRLGLREPPEPAPDPMRAWFAREGIRHERLIRDRFASLPDVTVTDIDTTAGFDAAEAATRQAMHSGAEVIYQAALRSYDEENPRRGYADFLVKVDQPSGFGPWSYEPVDAKLGAKAKPEHLAQTADYAVMLAGYQGTAPAQVHIVTGDGQRQSYPVDSDEVTAAWGDAAEAAAAINDGYEPAPPEPCSLCSTCDYRSECEDRWAAEGHLSLVGVRAPTRRKLADAGVSSVKGLAAADPDYLAKACGSNPDTIHKAVAQARLKVAADARGAPLAMVTDPGPIDALGGDHPADLFVDFEATRVDDGSNRYYLFGMSDADDDHTTAWANSLTEERAGFEMTLARMQQALADGGRVYHYGAYERTAMREMAVRHGHAEEVEAVFDDPGTVDLLAVARASITTSAGSYAQSTLEAMYAPGLRDGDPVLDAGTATWERERYVVTGQVDARDGVVAYNAADCVSMRRMRAWLRDLRDAGPAGKHLPASAPVPA